jgi:hypothetical protein
MGVDMDDKALALSLAARWVIELETAIENRGAPGYQETINGLIQRVTSEAHQFSEEAQSLYLAAINQALQKLTDKGDSRGLNFRAITA